LSRLIHKSGLHKEGWITWLCIWLQVLRGLHLKWRPDLYWFRIVSPLYKFPHRYQRVKPLGLHYVGRLHKNLFSYFRLRLFLYLYSFSHKVCRQYLECRHIVNLFDTSRRYNPYRLGRASPQRQAPFCCCHLYLPL
jgi:hypothetical protein